MLEILFNMTDVQNLIQQKLDPILAGIVNEDPAMVPIIVQTVDGLQDSDKRLMSHLGGKLKDNLYIINAFSADMSTDAVLTLIREPRVVRVYYDAEVRAV